MSIRERSSSPLAGRSARQSRAGWGRQPGNLLPPRWRGGRRGKAAPGGDVNQEPSAIAKPGSRLSQLKCDCFDDGVEVLIDLTQHDAHHSPALRLHPKVAVAVVSLDVCVAIDLDDQARLHAREVSEVLPDRMLAPKLH